MRRAYRILMAALAIPFLAVGSIGLLIWFAAGLDIGPLPQPPEER